MIVTELPLPEPGEGLFEGVGLVYSFGFGVTLVDCHKGTPDVGERTWETDVFGLAFTGDGFASVDAGKGASGQIVGEGVDLSVFLDHGPLAAGPPLKIDSERGVAQAGRAGIGKVVLELERSQEHTTVGEEPVAMLVEEEGFLVE